MALSRIEWTECTWNPLTGCTKISIGCENCYAEKMAHRLKNMGQKNYTNGFCLTTHPHVLSHPLLWKKPRRVFVNSMSDLFHDNVPDSFIHEVFKIMCVAKQHTFQVLTKRSERLKSMSPYLPWNSNIWMGVTVESVEYSSRIIDLASTGAAIKFLSLEPLLSDIPMLPLDGIDWVIVGGESGPGSRPMSPAWAESVLDQCKNQSVPFFFKQWGGINKKKSGRILRSRTWDEMPTPR